MITLSPSTLSYDVFLIFASIYYSLCGSYTGLNKIWLFGLVFLVCYQCLIPLSCYILILVFPQQALLRVGSQSHSIMIQMGKEIGVSLFFPNRFNLPSRLHTLVAGEFDAKCDLMLYCR